MSSFDDQRRARRDQAREEVRDLVQAAASGEEMELDRIDQLLAIADLNMDQFSAAVTAVERKLKAEKVCGTEDEISAEIAASNDRTREARVKLHQMTEEYRRQHGNPPPGYKVFPGMNSPGHPYPAAVPFFELKDSINREERLVYNLQRKLKTLTEAIRLAVSVRRGSPARP